MAARRLTEQYLDKVWGSPFSEPWFPQDVPGGKLGEVWFTGDPRPPLLIKFIFTTEALSIQSHPGGANGKTEMWHILRADPGSVIGAGLKREMGEAEFRSACLDGSIVDDVIWWPAKAGQTYFIPAGTVHAIGAGIALCEIQQYSDTTYRLFDYGRGRELHLDEGIAVSRRAPHPGPSSLPVSCEYFTTERLTVDGAATVDGGMVVILDGEGAIDGVECRLGQAWCVDGAATLTGHMEALVTRAP